MKKLMLSAAVAAFAFGVSPALAQDDSGVKLNLGGHFKGYVSYVSQDDDLGEVRDFDILRDTEVHFGGETTLDNGLTVGAHIETRADSDDSFDVDESYAYFAGSWGRVNFGDEDGAAYLLQVAAPSADENVDGLRQFINPFNYGAATANGTVTGFNVGGLDYDNDFAGDDDKITYLSPVFSGFQAGLSYTPEVGDASDGVSGNNTDDVAGDDGSAWEAAVRYEGTFNTVGVILGAGYTHVDLEEDLGTADDFNEWNVGADLDIGAFGVGAIYTENNNGDDANDENETWVVGGDYTTGPFKLGLSYLNNQSDASGADVESDRIAGGVVYTYGPGMTFRGSVQHVSHDIEAADDVDGTAVLLGTQINF
jgi:predicted porin